MSRQICPNCGNTLEHRSGGFFSSESWYCEECGYSTSGAGDDYGDSGDDDE